MGLRNHPSSRLSPKVVLHQALERLEDIEAVIVIEVDKEGFLTTSWSNTDSGTLAVAALLLSRKATNACMFVEEG